MTQFVIYQGTDEVLVTTTTLEKTMLKEWFDGVGRGGVRAITAYRRLLVRSDSAACIQLGATVYNRTEQGPGPLTRRRDT